MRLKTLIATGIICTAAFGSAGPAQAKSDNGNGASQRCIAAVNGQHKGFQCGDVVDDQNGSCPASFNLAFTSVTLLTADDSNNNGLVCARF
jgi:hypothetical protein